MNYLKIYNCLINKRKNYLLEHSNNLYTELHHILPKSCGGKNIKSNLVRLTAREHYIAHLLLLKIYENTIYYVKMLCALKYISKKFKYNSKLYSQLKFKLVENKFYNKIGSKGGKNTWNNLSKEKYKLLCKKISNSLKTNKEWKCLLCNITFNTRKELTLHNNTFHKNCCRYCGKEFESLNKSLVHMLHCIKSPKYAVNLEKIQKSASKTHKGEVRSKEWKLNVSNKLRQIWNKRRNLNVK